MFAPVNSNLVFPFSRAPEATHVILIAPRAALQHKVWLLCTNAGDSDYSLDHLVMNFSRRGAVRWDVRQCHHFSANSCGQGGHGTIFGGVSLLPLYDAHRKLIPLKGDVLNMNKVHNFGRVAVKIWDKLDSGMVRREVDFLQQSAGHPNISALLGIYAEAQRKKSSVVWLLVMEHCTGGDFFDIIKEKYLSIARILDIQAGLASALTHLHRLRIVHRDVKAENVVMHKEHAVLIDFGIAAYLDDQEAMCRPVGSPGYAAPEIIAPTPRLYDELVDVFALGVLSYFMIFRALPFWAGTHEEMLEKTRQCEVEIPELDDDSMRPVVSLVLRMSLASTWKTSLVTRFILNLSSPCTLDVAYFQIGRVDSQEHISGKKRKIAKMGLMSKEAADRPSVARREDADLLRAVLDPRRVRVFKSLAEAVACFNELREMAPEVTKSRKDSEDFMWDMWDGDEQRSRLCVGDISLDEFSENEGADRSEVPPSPTNNIDVSPVPTLRTPAAPAQTVQNLNAERSWECAEFGEEVALEVVLIVQIKGDHETVRPKVGQTVSKVFRNMAHLSEASMSTAAKPSQRNPSRSRQSSGEKAKENESSVVTSRQSGHCFDDTDGLGVLPSSAKHAQAEADAGPQQEDSSF
ncbi:mlkA [Symbiodinium sp. CCMP2456]|nr:mlkA [Symbiodinium sp. CCMP2456]